MTIEEINIRLKAIQEEQENLRVKRNNLRGENYFKCGCGSMHKINECTLIQTHWYTPPSGCSDGDYWNIGSMNILCPVLNHKNRLSFKVNDKASWKNRESLEYNAEKQFRSLYSPLFKNKIDDYGEDEKCYWRNYYVDENHEKFEIFLKTD